jgi:hypothetical protein
LQSSKEREPKPVQPRSDSNKERQINIMSPDRAEREKEARALSEGERASMELECVVRHMATALAQLHDSDQLAALQAWHATHVKHAYALNSMAALFIV